MRATSARTPGRSAAAIRRYSRRLDLRAADPLHVHPLELERDPEGDGGQNGELVGGVDALDVEGRVGLRVPEPLGLGEHVGEHAAPVAHLGQDEVAGPVDDPGQPLDAIRGQPLAHASSLAPP